jgi:hypothetical protein
VCKDLKRQEYGGDDHHPPIDEFDLKKMYEMFDLTNPKLLLWRVFCDIVIFWEDIHVSLLYLRNQSRYIYIFVFLLFINFQYLP